MCLVILKNCGSLVLILIFGLNLILSESNVGNEITAGSRNRNGLVGAKIISADNKENVTGEAWNFLSYENIVYSDDGTSGFLSDSTIVDSDYSNEDTDDSKPCLLDSNSDYMSWWVYPNGTLVEKLVRDARGLSLDFSHLTDNAEKLYEETAKKKINIGTKKFLAFSAASNQLTAVPFKALSVINETLSYLTLRGNNFASPNFILQGNADVSIACSWASFPLLKSLKELDITNCSIEFIVCEEFSNLPRLEGLYLSHNKIIRISSDLFKNIMYLSRLDLSYNDASDYSSNIYDPSREPYLVGTEGISISEFAFKHLKYLTLLDMSHTKISPYSARAFSYLGASMQFLSLCFTSLPIIANDMFANTNLRVMDLSGNPAATLSLHEQSFAGIEDTLEILSFENSRLKDVSWLKNLSQLKILKLSGNNINILHRPHFTNLKNLNLLDLSLNHIGNWYRRIFEENGELKLLNLRDNNINILTSEMYRDFSNLSFLAIGRNDFVCNCILRDLIDIAVANVANVNDSKEAKVVVTHAEEHPATIQSSNPILADKNNNILRRVESRIIKKFIPLLEESYINIKAVKQKLYSNVAGLWHRKHHGPTRPPLVQPEYYNQDLCHLIMPDGELLQFKFLLLDYEPDNYWCFNATTNAEIPFSELDACESKFFISNVPYLNTTHFLIIGFAVLSVALILILPLYLKWWYIKYLFVILKNSAAVKLWNKETGKQSVKSTPYVYDLFVSYCDRDREWVLEELLPNIEGNRDISICLHERDFEVGLSILENIISCMDRSRCFLLVISKCFLSSQWCQFEMYLAQHRLFQAKKDHLILIMLEDIPRLRRPKALQYLMKIKTYIRWPTSNSSTAYVVRSISEERKHFWIRLKSSLLSIEHTNEGDNETTV